MIISSEDAERALNEVAARNNTTVEEVRKQIKLAMLVAMCSQDATIQEKWKNIPSAGDVPTPEELMVYIAGEIK